ncbi:MAG: C1 family peptidase [Pirellulales bacterium]|nr:C1 family peptidase [Pirellulales bacterium]
MNHRIVLATCVFACLIWLVIFRFGQAQEGAITDEMITAFRNRMEQDQRLPALMNAATQNELRNLALNRELLYAHDHHYTNKIKTGEVTNQKSSGRCWLFAGFNLLRPAVIEKHKFKNFELSQNYSFFWDKLEKANLFLEGILETRDLAVDDRLVVYLLENPFPDGGQWNMVVDLIQKYGVVPLEVMPDTKHSSATQELNRVANQLLRKDAAILRNMHAEGNSLEAMRVRKAEMLAEIYRLLCYLFGEPPTSFEWRFADKDDKLSEWKTYTPKQFYEEFIGVDLSQFVCLHHCPAHPYGKLYQIRFDRDFHDRPNMTFINLEIEALKQFTLAQLQGGEPVWFGCDVGKEYYGDEGILRPDILDYETLLGMNLEMTKKERIMYRESVPTHAMVLQGVDIKHGRPVKWRVENSWGKEKGHEGYLAMYDAWFDTYLYSVIIHKKHLPKDVLSILEQEPVMLPPWDPMFATLR